MAIIAPDTTTGPRIKLVWDHPLNADGVIKGYRVSYAKAGSGNADLVTLNATTFTVLLLVCGGENYNIQVWAFSSKEGMKYAQSMSVPSYVPASPQGLTSVQINAMAYKISWRPVSSLNGTILTYEMSIRTRNSLQEKLKLLNNSCSDVACGRSSLHDCFSVLNDIDKCSKYNISVRAYTRRGPGSFSKLLIIQQKVSGIPKDFNVVSVVQATVTLEWKMLEDLIIPVKTYTVKYSGQISHPSCSCNDSSLNGKVATNSTKIIIRDLYPGTEYKFTVSATTECGEGQDSVMKLVQTKPADGKDGETQETKKCSPPTYLYITLVVIGVLVAIIVLLLVYIQHLRNKVKDLTREKKYDNSPQEAIVYENTSVHNGQPKEGIQMSNITTTVSPEYDFIDPLPRHTRHTVDQSGTLNTFSHFSKPLHGSKNIFTRPLPTVNKPNMKQQHNHEMSAQGRDNNSVCAVPSSEVTSNMDTTRQHITPCTPQDIHSLPVTSLRGVHKPINIEHEQSTTPSQSHGKGSTLTGPLLSKRKSDIPSQYINYSSSFSAQPNDENSLVANEIKNQCNSKTNTLSSRETSGVYQPLELSQQTNDTVYEELNDHTKTKTPLDSDDAFRFSSIYQPLKGDAQTSTYETLKLSDRCNKDKEVNI